MSESDSVLRIESAREDEVAVLLGLIRALADYEKLSHKVVATEEGLREWLFGPRAVAEALLARAGGEPVGFAVFFPTFSTFAGKPGLYLEDLFVVPQWRRRGVGRSLLARVARIACDRGCNRVSWAVLDWNRPALDFYRGLGAEPAAEWVGYSVAGEAFERLARLGECGDG